MKAFWKDVKDLWKEDKAMFFLGISVLSNLLHALVEMSERLF